MSTNNKDLCASVASALSPIKSAASIVEELLVAVNPTLLAAMTLLLYLYLEGLVPYTIVTGAADAPVAVTMPHQLSVVASMIKFVVPELKPTQNDALEIFAPVLVMISRKAMRTFVHDAMLNGRAN